MQLPIRVCRHGVEVDARQADSRSAEINSMPMPTLQSTSQGNGHGAAACAKVRPAPAMREPALLPQAFESEINQQLSLLTGNQRRWAAAKFQVAPWTASDEMLKWHMILNMPSPEFLQGRKGAGKRNG